MIKRENVLRMGLMLVCIAGLTLTGCSGTTVPSPAGLFDEDPVPKTGPTNTLGSTPEGASFQSQGIWTGVWESDQWGIMELMQDGATVTGTYTWDDGRIEGMVGEGRLAGTWSEAPSYQPPDDAGDFIFSLSEDGTSFTGKWRYGKMGNWQGSWNGHKVSRVLIGK